METVPSSTEADQGEPTTNPTIMAITAGDTTPEQFANALSSLIRVIVEQTMIEHGIVANDQY
jgi:hypothetical protein